MANGIKISFVLPAWKGAFLREAIGSIVTQTSQDWELIVVDDCSPEPLEEIVGSFDDPRIRYYRNEQNLGGKNLVRQWNHCITFATGDFIVLAADDDIYKPEFCAECIRLAEKYPQVNLIHSSVQTIDEEGKPIGDDVILPEFTSKYEYLNWWVTGRLLTCVGNFAFRRTSLLGMGGFVDFPCAFGSDVATPIALSVNGVANTAEMQFCFRQSSLHLSADTSRFKEKLEAISQLSEWLQALHFEVPDNPKDKEFYAVMTPDSLHRKVVYEYFHLVIKYLPLGKVPEYLKYCRLASAAEKSMMALRWFKHHIWK